jgi:putative tricarboxylic transport membrane protein
MRRLDRIFIAFWILLGLAVCAYAFQLGLFGPSGPESGFFPFVTGLLLTGSGVGLAVGPGQRIEAQGGLFDDAGARRRVILVIAAVAAMIFLMPWIGFLTTAAVVSPLLLRAIEPRSWAFCVVTGGTASVLIVLLFARVLDVPLPVGPLGF